MRAKPSEPSPLDRPEIVRTIFCPRHDDTSAPPKASQDLLIDVSDNGVTLCCRFHLSDKEAPVILYFHGNGEIVSDYDTIASSYTDVGINLFIATYRGYGLSSGVPSVSALMSDNGKIHQYLKHYLKDNGFTGALFAMGRSLGSASAIDLVSRFPDNFKGLILDSAFADTEPLVKRLGYDISVHGIAEEACFNNLQKIRKISIPTLMFHGSRDLLIPVTEAERLQAESGAKSKQFHIVPGADHNSIITIGGSLYFETIKKFIDTATGKNTWRQRRRSHKNKRDPANG